MSNKFGRNEPCPCGSGKKYKKCCIDNDNNLIPHKVALPTEFFNTKHDYNENQAEYLLTDRNEYILPHNLEYIVHDIEELQLVLKKLNCITTINDDDRLHSFDIRYDKDINNVAMKFNHQEMPKGYDPKSFGVGMLYKDGFLSINTISAPIADILYHFFKETFLCHICELRSITYHRYPWTQDDFIYYQEIGSSFPEDEIEVIDSDEEYDNLVKLSAEDNGTNKTDPNLILDYILDNVEEIERIELLNSKFDERYISKKLYFNHIGSYVKVKMNFNE